LRTKFIVVALVLTAVTSCCNFGVIAAIEGFAGSRDRILAIMEAMILFNDGTSGQIFKCLSVQ